MMAQQNLQGAMANYQKAIALQPNQPVWVYVGWGDALNQNGQIEEAISAYQELINQKLPRNANLDKIDSIYNTLGEVILKLSVRQGEFSRAITFFQTAIGNYPHKEWSHYHLGSILAKQDKIDEAIACFEKAVQIRPKFPLGLLSLGELLLKVKCRNQAFQCGLKILQHQGLFANGELNTILIRLLAVHSNPKQSKEALHKAIEQIEKSDSQPGLKINTYQNIGRLLQDRGQLSEASYCYQKSIYHRLQKLNPQFIERYWNIGKLQQPNFLILGFAKCGTTAFYDYLCQHPQVLPAIKKEPMYLYQWLAKLKDFEERNWSWPSLEKELYLAHFAPRPERSRFVTGEASTNNVLSGCEKIIYSWFPNIKLIVLLREPVKRTISHYEQFLTMGLQNRSLEQVINSELEELEATSNLAQTITEKLKSNWWREQVASSLYIYHLERWMNLFPREQFLILTNEDLAQYPAETMKQTFDFLGLPECNSINYEPRNVGSYPQVDANLLSRLSNFFQPHNQRLEEFLGRKFNW